MPSMELPTCTAVVVAVLLLATVAGVTPTAGADPGPSVANAAPGDVDPDSVLLRADVAANGSAEWTVEYRIRLGGNRTEAYEDLAADIEDNRSAYLDPFRDRMTRTVQAAANATGRDMVASDFTISTRRTTFGQEYGVVTYQFRWDQFAAVDGDRLRVGDAVAGLFLDAETSLQFAYPSEYRVVEVSPPTTERRDSLVEWEGAMSFTANEPTLVVTSAAPGPDLTMLVAGALAAVAVLAGGAYVYRRRDRGGDETPHSPPPSPDAEQSTEGGSGPAETDAESAEEMEPPSELLSNEERVLQLLEQHGGRVKQQQIVGDLDWTEAKTSQVVNAMRDEGDVEVFRIGRENVVKLPEEDEDGEGGTL